MLDVFLTHEAPELQQRKENLLAEAAEHEAQLADLEQQILGILGGAQGNILEDEMAVQMLSKTKVIIGVYFL